MQVFQDLLNYGSSHEHEECDTSMQIHEDQVLGKGAFGLVCNGELQDENVRLQVAAGRLRNEP